MEAGWYLTRIIIYFSVLATEEIEILTRRISIEMVVKSIDYMMTEEFQLTILLLTRKIQKKQFSAMAIETPRNVL